MTTVTTFVPRDIASKCEEFIAVGSVSSVKKGVETLLTNNLYIEGCATAPGAGQRDVSALLKKGLTILANSPHETLGVSVGAKTQEIRKAYKKNALKYHPDKNPLTTPLFQVIHSACDKLTDRDTRAKEESKAAAAASRPSNTSSAQPGRQSQTGAKGAYEQYRQQYSQDSSKQQSHSRYNQQAPPQPQPQAQRAAPQYQSNFYSQDEATRKARYEEFVREQQKKADSDKRAKEFADAAKQRQQQQQSQFDPGAFRREAEERQKARYQAENNARREEILKQAAAAEAAQNAFNAASAGYNSSRSAAPTSSAAYKEKDPYRRRSFEGEVPKPAGYTAQNPNLRAFKPNPTATPGAASGGTGATSSNTSSSSSSTSTSSTKNPYYSCVYPTNLPNESSRASAAPSGAKVPPINIPKPATNPSGGAYNSYANIYGGENSARSDSGGLNTGRSTSSTGSSVPPVYSNVNYKYAAHHEAANTSAKNTPVPRPYGLKCTSVGATLLELEWNTSLTYKNILVVELCWRYLGGNTLVDSTARKTWESANKLISSGKCRKKNLIAGGQYEFRVRAVEELIGGMLGMRSEWSESITVALVQPHGQAQPSAQAQGQAQGYASSSSTQRQTAEPVNISATDKALNAARQQSGSRKSANISPTSASASVQSSGTSYSYIGADIKKHTQATSNVPSQPQQSQQPVYHNTPTNLPNFGEKETNSSKQATPPPTQPPPAATTFQRFAPKVAPEPTAAPNSGVNVGPSAPTVPAAAAPSSIKKDGSPNVAPAPVSGGSAAPDKTANRHYYAPLNANNSTTNLPTATPAAAATPQVHKFTTLDENNKEQGGGGGKAVPVTATPTATSTSTSTSGVTLNKSASKSVLSSSAREAWGKDSIRIEPQTPPTKNLTKNSSNSSIYSRGNINRSKISSNNINTATAGVDSANTRPMTLEQLAAQAGNTTIQQQQQKQQQQSMDDHNFYEVDEDIDYSSGDEDEDEDEDEDDEGVDIASVDEDELTESAAANRANLRKSAAKMKSSSRARNKAPSPEVEIPYVPDDVDEDGDKYNLRSDAKSGSADSSDVAADQSINEHDDDEEIVDETNVFKNEDGDDSDVYSEHEGEDDEDDDGYELHGVDSSSKSIDIGIAFKTNAAEKRNSGKNNKRDSAGSAVSSNSADQNNTPIGAKRSNNTTPLSTASSSPAKSPTKATAVSGTKSANSASTTGGGSPKKKSKIRPPDSDDDSDTDVDVEVEESLKGGTSCKVSPKVHRSSSNIDLPGFEIECSDDEDNEADDVYKEKTPKKKTPTVAAAAAAASLKQPQSSTKLQKQASTDNKLTVDVPLETNNKPSSKSPNASHSPLTFFGADTDEATKPHVEVQVEDGGVSDTYSEDDEENEEEDDDESDDFDGDEEQWFELCAPPVSTESDRSNKKTNTVFKHIVRAEPFLKSKQVGWLVGDGYSVLATADCGDWLKVQIHEPLKASKSRDLVANTVAFGWCLRSEMLPTVADGNKKKHDYLRKTDGLIKEYNADVTAAPVATAPTAPKLQKQPSVTKAGGVSVNSGQSTRSRPATLNTTASFNANSLPSLPAHLSPKQVVTATVSPYASSITAAAAVAGVGGTGARSKAQKDEKTPIKKSSSAASTGMSTPLPATIDKVSPSTQGPQTPSPLSSFAGLSLNGAHNISSHRMKKKTSSPYVTNTTPVSETKQRSRRIDEKLMEIRKSPAYVKAKKGSGNGSSPYLTANTKRDASAERKHASPATQGSSQQQQQQQHQAQAAIQGQGQPIKQHASQGRINPDGTSAINSTGSRPPTTQTNLPTVSSTKSLLNTQHSVHLSASNSKAELIANRSAYKIQRPSGPDTSHANTPSRGARANSGDDFSAGGIATPGIAAADEEDTVIDVWHELFDDAGHAYYFNELTCESTWDPPEWIEEIDPESGHKYYVKLTSPDPNALESTWTKPEKYAKLIRTAV